MMSMSKKQWTIIACITALFAFVGITESFQFMLESIIVGFIMSYGSCWLYNLLTHKKQMNKQTYNAMTPEQQIAYQQQKQQEKLQKKQERQAKRRRRQAEWAKNQAEFQKKQAERQQQRQKSWQIKCPRCGSTNVVPLERVKKSFSVGKAVGGAALAGGIGLLAGFAGKNTKKVIFVCANCGKQFKH